MSSKKKSVGPKTKAPRKSKKAADAEAAAAAIAAAAAAPQRIHFPPYDPAKLHTDPGTGRWMNPSILFFGGRRTGKSTKGKELFYRIRKKFAVAFLWTMTGLATRVFGDAFYNCFCFEVLDIKQVEIAIKLMKYLRLAYPDGVYGLELNALFCFDDCGSVKESRDKVMNQLTANGRNDGITVCNMIQALSQITNHTRTNSEVFITNYIKQDERPEVWKEFFKDIPDFDMFEACIEQYTKRYGSLVKTPPPPECSSLSEFIFAFRINPDSPTPPFTITSPFMDLIAMTFQASAEQLRAKMLNNFQRSIKSKAALKSKEAEKERRMLEAQRKSEESDEDDEESEDDENENGENDATNSDAEEKGNGKRKGTAAKKTKAKRKSTGKKGKNTGAETDGEKGKKAKTKTAASKNKNEKSDEAETSATAAEDDNPDDSQNDKKKKQKKKSGGAESEEVEQKDDSTRNEDDDSKSMQKNKYKKKNKKSDAANSTASNDDADSDADADSPSSRTKQSVQRPTEVLKTTRSGKQLLFADEEDVGRPADDSDEDTVPNSSIPSFINHQSQQPVDLFAEAAAADK
jgi:hypothetical protein